MFGMVIGVPVFSIIYAAFKANVESKLKNKNMPSDTGYYMKSDYYPDNIDESERPNIDGEQLRLKSGAQSEKKPGSRDEKKG